MVENGRWNQDGVKRALDNADVARSELYDKSPNTLSPQKQLNEFKFNVKNIFKILDQIISKRDVLQHALKGTTGNKQHEDGRTETIDYKFHEPKERFGDAKGALKDIENSSDAINKELKGMTTIFDGVVLEFVIPKSFLMTPTDIKLDIGHGEQLLNRVVGFEQHVIVTDKFLERGKIWQEKIEDIRENYAVYKTIRGKLDDWYKYMKALNEQVFKAQSAGNLPELDDAYIEYWDDLLNYDRRYEPQSLDFDSLSDELDRFKNVMSNLEKLIGKGQLGKIQVDRIPGELSSYVREQLDGLSRDINMAYFDVIELYENFDRYMSEYVETLYYIESTKLCYDRYLENLEKLLKDEQQQAQNTNVGGFLSKWLGHNNTPVPNTDAINNIRRVKAIFRCELYPG